MPKQKINEKPTQSVSAFYTMSFKRQISSKEIDIPSYLMYNIIEEKRWEGAVQQSIGIPEN